MAEGERRDHGRITLHLCSGEDRLYEPALGLMRLALAGEKAVTEQPTGSLEQSSLGDFRRVIHQQGADVTGMREQSRVVASEAESCHVALFARDALEKAGRVGVEGREVP